MANENRKDFNAMLHDSKDMPKFQIITDQKSIEKYGGSKMYFAPPIDYDNVMKKIPHGKVITIGKMSGNESDTGRTVKRSHLPCVGDRRKNIL